jgi:predicted CoA-substrate-specific enzyme activase
MDRHLGIDAGAESLKVVEIVRDGEGFRWTRRARVEHAKDLGPPLLRLLRTWGWEGLHAAAATGRLGRQLALDRMPARQARVSGHRFLHGDGRHLIIDVGAHGFSVLDVGGGGAESYRENSRCSQGTGNFLRQLVERFGLTPEEADALAAPVADPAPLSGRCPVILKTDMTHLANKGEDRPRIVAGLFDAMCDNVQVLVKAHGPARAVLTGGVARSRRVRQHFRRFLEERGIELVESGEDVQFLDALGCALLAASSANGVSTLPPLERLVAPPAHEALAEVPALRGWLPRVRRLGGAEARRNGEHAPASATGPGAPRAAGAALADALVLGLDIGSTGSKAVAIDAVTGAPVWEAYVRTGGDPVGAAQRLVRDLVASDAGRRPVVGIGATGSGREIVGSLMATCYGPEVVHVLTEIAAHARGALEHDPRVDTIFEIGGQDAKYIRLDGGRVVDAAMNEACSAGTGSFIEEQGRRLGGLEVTDLAREALAAEGGVALGQHCSVFMAEILDEAAAAGIERPRIVAGLYDSVVQNYLNRVKGPRPVGRVVFCQGMPFSSDALAAAVARQTGAEVIVPPSPGTIGALGIALLARDAVERRPVDPGLFLHAQVERKDTFVCRSKSGCGGSGNACRIDRLRTVVAGDHRTFTWGGACALYDGGTRKGKLPDGAPDPFRERSELVDALVAGLGPGRGGRRVAIAEAFQLKGLFPFFATFLAELGLDLAVVRNGGRAALKRGIEAAHVPFCAPMQQYHGLALAMADTGADLIFAPMLRELPRVKDERQSWTCPIVQSSPDVLRNDLRGALGERLLSPVFHCGPGALDAPVFLDACRALAESLGVAGEAWRPAHARARAAQLRFDEALLDVGRRALARCRAGGLLPVVVLGRTYTIHDDVLNSNVPALLREQGAVPIPVDCFPTSEETPVIPGAFWGYGQRILRAAHEVRRTPGLYGLFASNYACGPDSFTLHAFTRLMEGKPYAIIETDGHAGDAGTKTRVEAFLHCVREDLRSGASVASEAAAVLALSHQALPEIARRGARVLVPPMGPEAQALAAVLQGYGVPAEVLPHATADTIRAGRRHTSGKECLPMIVTLGALLERIERSAPGERLTFFMPGSNGPCRFGYYRQLHQMILERLGHAQRVGIWSPPDSDYFEGVPAGFGALVFLGCTAYGLLDTGLRDVRPVERRALGAKAIHDRHAAALGALLRQAAGGDLSAGRVLAEVASGRCWGIPALLARAARELAALRDPRPYPTALLVGEIYIRSDAASNGFAADELERRGVRVRVDPVTGYLQYSDRVNARRGLRATPAAKLKTWLRSRMLERCRHAMAAPLGWMPHPTLDEVLEAGAPYLREDLEHEAVLAVGLPVHGWRRGEYDGVLCVGPLECMPNKLVEAQLVHVQQREGIPALTLSLNGDPIDADVLDAFAFDVQRAHAARR